MDTKKFIIIGGSVIGILILLLVVLFVISSKGPKYVDFDTAETKMVEATERYYRKNAELLPTMDGKYSLGYSSLEQAGLIKPLSQLIKNGETCSGNVIVVKRQNSYTYVPYINCGDMYTSKELYKKVLEDNPVVTDGYTEGLYKSDSTYYFRGKNNVNNYVAFGSIIKNKKETPILWRILSIDGNGYVKLKALRTPLKSAFDTRFNPTKNSMIGYNDFDLSELSLSLKKIETLDWLKENELSKLVPRQLCIGARSVTDNTTNGISECSKLSRDKYLFGTVNPYEYMRVSLDSQCTSLESRSCLNRNFLSLEESNSWTTTPVDTNDYEVYYFDGVSFEKNQAKTRKDIYPTIVLSELSFFKGGNGTETEPYIVK